MITWDTVLYLSLLGVSAFAYLINYRVLTPALQALALVQTITWLATLYAIYIVQVEDAKNNLYVFHGLYVVQYGLLSAMYYFAFSRRTKKTLVLISAILYTIVAVSLSLTIQPVDQYNSYAITIFNVLMGSWSAAYIWEMFSEIKLASLESEPMFWVSVGYFFTCLGNFFVQGLMQYLINRSLEHALAVYWIQELMHIILVIIILLALYSSRLFSSPT